jgi:hypothetical protein
MNSNDKIRQLVGTIARKIKSEQKLQLKEEMKLRRHIRKMLREIEEVSPHESTGVNVLEDLLKTIVPILEASYKRLTSDEQQRSSFRSHILRAVQNLLSTESIYFRHDRAGGNKAKANVNAPAAVNEAEEEKDKSNVEDDPAFIDIEKEKKAKEAEQSQPKPEDAFAPIVGEDPTGRGFALRAFQKIQKQILDSYSLLGKDEDREVFYDYLITNLKLYFDKFEDELHKSLDEPTTPEYEEEKKKKVSMLGGSLEEPEQPEPKLGEEEPEEELT